MIDIRKLKELVRLMVANDLSELDLRDSEEQVTLRRHTQSGPGPVTLHAPVGAAAPSTPAAAPAVTPPPADEGLHRIESPMVGTYYSAPNPDAQPFVTAGSSISPDTVVCLVEAMKIFNEIKAECSGTIERTLVKNGDSVEFGQPMFLVRTE